MTDTPQDADTLARFLDGDGSLNGRVTGETRALASLARRLESAAAQPEPSRRGELRDELLEAARERQAAPPLRMRLRRWLEGAQPRRPRVPAVPRLAAATRAVAVPRVAALVGAAIVVVSGSGIAYGSEAALPGDTLYSVKLAVEDTRLAFESDRSTRGTMHLDRAAERISEAEAAAASSNDAGAASALRHANDSARAGAGALIFSYRAEKDPELIDRLATFTTTQSGRLTTLASGLDGEAADVAASTLVAFAQIQAEATALGGACPDCEDAAPASDQGSASEGRPTPTQVEPFEASEPENPGGATPSPPREAAEPPPPPEEMDPGQPQDATPDTPSTHDPTAEAPATMPRPWDPDAWDAEAWDADEPWDSEAWTPDDEAPLDPPDRDEEPDGGELFEDQEPPDLPF